MGIDIHPCNCKCGKDELITAQLEHPSPLNNKDINVSTNFQSNYNSEIQSESQKIPQKPRNYYTTLKTLFSKKASYNDISLLKNPSLSISLKIPPLLEAIKTSICIEVGTHFCV